ncbi:hypothetical protein [Agromyces sp. SYSU T00194]|uniref:hypothetical protein n=1 Tax=Agromyces chitinivorans TaxID=3158560 RepID=UPI0033917D66
MAMITAEYAHTLIGQLIAIRTIGAWGTPFILDAVRHDPDRAPESIVLVAGDAGDRTAPVVELPVHPARLLIIEPTLQEAGA